MTLLHSTAPSIKHTGPDLQEITSADDTDDSRGPIIPADEWLAGRFKVKQLLKRENHADVYLVNDMENASEGEMVGLEARAFNLMGLSQRHLKYRVRAMKRLSSRCISKTKWNNLDVIIYKCGDVNVSPENTAMKAAAPSHDGDVSIMNIVKKPPAKTGYKQESERLRQRDRRQAKRQRKKMTTETESYGTAAEIENVDDCLEMKLDDKAWTMLTLLHIAHSTRPLRKLLPDSSQLIVNNYLSMKDCEIKLTTEEEMVGFAQIKEQELAYLARQLSKVNAAKKQCHDCMGELLRQQLLHPKGSKEWLEIQRNDIEPKKQNFRILRTAIKVLPDLIAAAKARHQSVSQKLALRRQEMQEEKKKQNLEMKLEELSSKLENYDLWQRCVAPASDTFFHLTTMRETVRKQMSKLEERE
ncbi:hypothetical protein TRIATDRAFT_317019 [Trichoderma atroviride IMI 206040]|uniref:Uncharacterized protein n=1 Tax=Hypocrea atroviridis (strain ATCC 20476 / IMI 206040) TaxID=452589 RepID=G9NR92_HYPAI|nr:uncharacterized protein TRIATDRAFT_317019 [Trichoderma atroviride IMI 206040]EHK47060.1 hypothetical protein TRIATDRAFT_317019 [Trichoderma atroviride IMI 206040]